MLVKSISKTVVTCADVCFDITMCCAIRLRITERGSRRIDSPDLNSGCGFSGGVGNLRVDLVGRDLEQRLIAVDLIARLLDPADDSALRDRFSHLRHDDIDGHRATSYAPNRRKNMRRVLFLAAFVACASQQNNIRIVKNFRDSRERGDLTGAQAYIAPGARLWFEE